jgi:hypothetical protein
MEPTPAADADEAPTNQKTPFLHGKRIPSAILAGGAAFAMTLAGLGIANAQTDDATPPSTTAPAEDGGRPGPGHRHFDHPHARLSVAAEAIGIPTAELKAQLLAGKTIAQVAEAKGVDVQKVIDALVADATTMLNNAVDNGRITREQADARIAELPEHMTNFVNRTPPADGEGHGPKGPGRPGPGIKASAEAVAKALGMTPEELKAGHEAGKSIATMATEKGIDVQTVIDALVADARAHLAQAVTDGKLTQAQADERSADLEEHITAFVNRTPPADGERGPKGPGHGPGMRANLDAAATALGITPEELRTELQAGKSLATIAGEKGVEVSKVVDALVADAKAHLAQAVADGKLTQAEADERAADLEARITDLVNRVGRPHDGERRPGPGPGPGADAPADGSTDAEPATFTA